MCNALIIYVIKEFYTIGFVFFCFFYLTKNRMVLNCIVVDDSSLQRMIITKMVNNNHNLQLIGDFDNAIDAKNCLTVYKVDLVFLDIEMPVINGFDFIDGLKSKPQIVFITGKPEYAARAFDYEATDFIQKPITSERFKTSVKKALEYYKRRNEIENEDEFIFVKSNLKRLKVYLKHIKWIEACKDYSNVVTENETFKVLSTMKSFEKILPLEKFFRIHKSYIINIDKVDHFYGTYAEIGDKRIPLSRYKKNELIKLLNKF